MRRLVAIALFACVGTGCASRTAGYQDVRSLVRERTGHDVRWRAVDDGGDVDDTTRKLLAKPLSTERAIVIALLHNPELQASFEALGREQAELLSARLPPNPEVDVGFFFAGSDHDPDIHLGITESVSDFVMLPFRQGVAEGNLDAAAIEVTGAALDLAYEVRVAFIRYLAARDLATLSKLVAAASKASFDAAEKLHAAGNVTDLDRDREHAIFADAELELAQAELVLATEREALNALMGLGGDDPGWTVTGSLPPPPAVDLDAAELEEKALARSLDLRALERRYDASESQADIATADGWLPDLRAGIGMERDEHDWKLGPVGSVEIPLFDRGQAEVRAAESDMRRARAHHRSATIEIQSTARAAARMWQASRRRAIHYREVLLPIRKMVTSGVLLRYNAMTTGVFELLAARRDEVRAEQAYVEALETYWVARAQVEQLLRGRLPDRPAGGAWPPASRRPAEEDRGGAH